MIADTSWTTLISVHKDLLIAKEFVYDRCCFECSKLRAEEESKDYGAYRFQLDEMHVNFRVAKITPTKTGQFVTLWKRNKNGIIEPFEISDNIDLYIISTRNDKRLGQFIFPKSVLHEKGIVSDNKKEGKRAMRVYPPWDITTSKQAQKTQQWQLKYFLEIQSENPMDLNRMKDFFIN